VLTVKLNHFQLTTLTYILSVIHNGLNWNGVTRTVICFNHRQHVPIAYAGISGNQRQFCVFYPTEANWQTAHSYLARLPCMSHTHIAHTYQFPSSPWAGALDHCMVSVLRSRVGWASARNNEQTNTPQRQHIAPLGKNGLLIYTKFHPIGAGMGAWDPKQKNCMLFRNTNAHKDIS